MRHKKITIRGKKWTIKLQRPPVKKLFDGLCDYDEKIIYIHPNATAGITATLIHEILHACLPDLNEESILECEAAIAEGLKKLKP
jgi:hypothetical protein